MRKNTKNKKSVTLTLILRLAFSVIQPDEASIYSLTVIIIQIKNDVQQTDQYVIRTMPSMLPQPCVQARSQY